MKKFLSGSLALLLSLSLAAGSGLAVSAAENDVIRNDAGGIPDPVLYAAALNAGDQNKDGILTVGEAEAITELFIEDRGLVSDCAGIDYLTGLNRLSMDLSDDFPCEELTILSSLPNLTLLGLRNIEDLSGLSGLTNLVSLGIGTDDVTDLSPLSKLTGLKRLLINSEFRLNHSITDLSPLSSLTNLVELYIRASEVTDLSPLSSLTNLTRLYIHGEEKYIENEGWEYGGATDLSPLASLINLTELELDSSASDLSPLISLSKLKRLWLWSSQMTDVSPLASLNQLKNLSLTSKQLTDITPLSGLTGLEKVSLWECNIADLSPIAHCTNLNYLNARGNQISTLPNLTHMKYLVGLYLGDNLLAALPDMTSMTWMRSLELSENLLTEEELRAKVPAQFANDPEWINRNKYQPDPEPLPPESHPVVTDPSEKIPDDVAGLLGDETVSGVTVPLTRPDVADSTVFEALKENPGKTVSFEVQDKTGSTAYQWTFVSAGEIVNPDVDVNLEIRFETEKQREIEQITGQQNMFYVSFAHHGELPGPARVRVYVGDRFRDGETVFFYYYNEEDGTIEPVDGGAYVSGGYAEFTIRHCSEYFLTDTAVEGRPAAESGENPGTGDSAPLVWLSAAASLGVVGGCLVWKKRRTAHA